MKRKGAKSLEWIPLFGVRVCKNEVDVADFNRSIQNRMKSLEWLPQSLHYLHRVVVTFRVLCLSRLCYLMHDWPLWFSLELCPWN